MTLRRFPVRFFRCLIFSKYLLHLENLRHLKKKKKETIRALMAKIWNTFCFFFVTLYATKRPDETKSVWSEVCWDNAWLKKKPGKLLFRTGRVISLGYSVIIEQPYPMYVCMYSI